MKKEYYLGIDLLKILSMLMICILHILGQGGILENTIFLSPQYNVSWLLEIFAYCAVNCFALVSGYLNFSVKHNYKKFLNLWLSVLFYNIIIINIFSFYKGVNFTYLLLSMLPLLFNEYWYLSCYFFIFLFIPLLNAGTNNVSRKYLKNVIICCLGIVSISSIVFKICKIDAFTLNRGYSVIWLIILYLIGVYIKKYKPFNTINKNIFLITFFVVNTFSYVVKMTIEQIYFNKGIIVDGGIFVEYTSICVIISSISLFLFFERINYKKIAFVSTLSKHSFFVYIIHCNPIIWEFVLCDMFKFCSNYSSLSIVAIVILSALFIYCVCIILDMVKTQILRIFSM